MLRRKRPKGDSLDSEEVADGITGSKPKGDDQAKPKGSDQAQHEQFTRIGGAIVSGKFRTNAENAIEKPKKDRAEIKRKEQKSEHAVPSQEKLVSALFWTLDFIRKAAESLNSSERKQKTAKSSKSNKKEEEIELILSFIKNAELEERFTKAAKKILSHSLTSPPPESLNELIKATLSIGRWVELMQEVGMLDRQDFLQKLYEEKQTALGATRKDKDRNDEASMIFHRSQPVPQGWVSASSPLESTLIALGPILSELKPAELLNPTALSSESLTHETRLFFHTAPITEERPKRRYNLFNSENTLRSIREHCSDDHCTEQNGLLSRAFSTTFNRLFHDIPETQQYIQLIFERFPRILNEIQKQLASTKQKEGLLERIRHLGFRENSERVPMEITPELKAGKIDVTRYSDNDVVIEVEIIAPHFSRTSSSLPEDIVLPEQESLSIVEGQLRIGITTSDSGEPQVYGGALVMDGLELTDEQRTEQIVLHTNSWINPGNQLPDGALQGYVKTLTEALINDEWKSFGPDDEALSLQTEIKAGQLKKGLSNINNLRRHQSRLSSSLFSELISNANAAFTSAFENFEAFVEHVKSSASAQTPSEYYATLQDLIQVAIDKALAIRDVQIQELEDIDQVRTAWHQISTLEQSLKEAVKDIRTDDSKYMNKKKELKIEGKMATAEEEKRLKLMMSYAYILNEVAVQQLSQSRQEIITHHPEVTLFKDQDPENPDDT